jgi:hypothetical protein
VDRDRIIVGNILGFQVNGYDVGAMAGEVTVRRNVEYYDAETEQSFGTLKKSLTTDKRFVEASLAQVDLDNLHRAWNDGGHQGAFRGRGLVQELLDADSRNYGFGETAPKAITNDGSEIFFIGDTINQISRMDSLGRGFPVKAGNAAAAPTQADILGLVFNTDTGQGYLADATSFASFNGRTGARGDDINTADYAANIGPVSMCYDSESERVIGITGATGVNFSTVPLVGHPTPTALCDGIELVTNPGSDVTGWSGVAFDPNGNILYAVRSVTGDKQIYSIELPAAATDPAIATPVAALTNADGTADTNFGLDPATYGIVSPQDITYFDNQIWMLDGKAATSAFPEGPRAVQVPVRPPDAGRGYPIGDAGTYDMNAPSQIAEDLENEVKVIAPATDGKIRAYKWPLCVSLSEGEHMYQKGGQTSVPLSFEILADPNERNGHYGQIKEFPNTDAGLAAAEAF